MSVRTLPLLLLLLYGLPLNLLANTDWSQCTTPVITRDGKIDYDLIETEIVADRVSGQNSDFMRFEGSVELHRGQQQISADLINLYKNPQRIEASGNLTYADDLYHLQAKELSFDNSAETGMFSQVSFQLYENHLSGSADRIVQLNAELSELYDVTYSTCDPQQNTWSLSAGKLELDQQLGFGTAHNALLRIADVPVFYFPWFRFPITDQRLSGILTPSFSHSDRDGDTLAIPVYWNQAENYDMTITPIWYSRRGLQLNTENRYLLSNHYGRLDLSWLDDDEFEAERWFRKWQHEAASNAGITTSILLQRVSDSEFFDDFDIQENNEDIDYLQSAVSFSTLIADWSAQLLFEEYQTINLQSSLASQPYKRLPRITLERDFSSPTGGINTVWKNEWVRFDKDDSITGDRLHISPTFNFPIENDGYYFKPSLQLDYTQYSLDNNTGDDNSINRSIPLFSIDSGLIFERQAGSSGDWIQTLEPRLYLLYVPYEDQQNIPDFDTALLADSYNNLFINNRFSGSDRIGDSQQVSFGLSTRFLNSLSGGEIFSASIGQAFYHKERRVSLNETVDERDKSNLISTMRYKPQPEWDIQLTSVYDQAESESTQTDISLRRHAQQQAFNLEYHFRRDQLEQSTLSFVYPVSINWTAFAKRQYSIKEDKPVQNLFGFAYESCCWGFHMLYEESSDNNFEEVDRTVFFQLTLKGLGGAGKDIDSILEDGILGYQPAF